MSWFTKFIIIAAAVTTAAGGVVLALRDTSRAN